MKIYAIRRHRLVEDTVEVFAESEAEAITKAHDVPSTNPIYLEVIRSRVIDTQDADRPLAGLLREAEEYMESLGTYECIEFGEVDAEFQTEDYSGKHSSVTRSVSGAFWNDYEIEVTFDESDFNESQPLCNFTDVAQYRICEAILKHKQ